jgi:hypothetical protein
MDKIPVGFPESLLWQGIPGRIAYAILLIVAIYVLFFAISATVYAIDGVTLIKIALIGGLLIVGFKVDGADKAQKEMQAKESKK